MISEPWKLSLNIQELRSHLEKVVLPLPPVWQSKAFGGWSVLSSNGSYQDGWHKGHLILNQDLKSENFQEKLQKVGGKETKSYKVPTEICTGYLKSVMDQIQKAKLSPARARIICLQPGMSSIWHRDAPDHIYAVRLHIPIITNPGCFFETRQEREHLPADGSARFLFVNREHRVVNEGTSPRYHLVVDVEDRHGLSRDHRHPECLQASRSLKDRFFSFLGLNA